MINIWTLSIQVWLMECEHDVERIGFEEIDWLAMIIGKKDVDVDVVFQK